MKKLLNEMDKSMKAKISNVFLQDIYELPNDIKKELNSLAKDYKSESINDDEIQDVLMGIENYSCFLAMAKANPEEFPKIIRLEESNELKITRQLFLDGLLKTRLYNG